MRWLSAWLPTRVCRSPNPIPPRSRWRASSASYGDKSSDAAAFNRGVQAYSSLLLQHPPTQWSPAKTDFEA